RLSECKEREREERHRETDLEDRLVAMRKELEPDDACQEKDEDAELEAAEHEPRSVGPREVRQKRPLELLLDVRRRVPVVVEQLLLAGVEHQPAHHDVDTDDGHPVGDAVEDRPLTDDGVRLVRSGDWHSNLLVESREVAARLSRAPVARAANTRRLRTSPPPPDHTPPTPQILPLRYPI